MNSLTTDNTALTKLKNESTKYEALLCGYFWLNPDLYSLYSLDKLNYKTFLNNIWGFYFGLGRQMFEKGYKDFSDLVVEQVVDELGQQIRKKYDKFGGYEIMEELIEEVEGMEANFDSYYEEVKKYALLKSMYGLFGDQVIKDETNKKYNYKLMTKEQLLTYWTDKVNRIAIENGDTAYEEHLLLGGLEESVEEWDKNPSIGLPFYQSKYMNNICTGWDTGHLYMFGGFGGSGKTSLMFNKVIMACIENHEPLLVIANEQSVQEFRQMLLVTAMGTGTRKTIKRQRLNEGNFTDEEREKLHEAIEWVREITDGNEGLIKFVFMDNYVMDDVKSVIRHYANRNIRRVIVDTGKPSEGSGEMPRWERFTEDMKELYKLARKNGGGLDLALWVNTQLADSAIKQRFLNEYALGESKKAKNEASVLFLTRVMWDDEYDHGGDSKHRLICHKYVDKNKEPFSEYESRFYNIISREKRSFGAKDKPYRKVEFTIKPDTPHYLLFTAKNRRGQDNKVGLEVLVLRPNFNSNTWDEVGWTVVHDDKLY